MQKIHQEFFQRNPVTCSRDLIGCVFHWNGCAGKIVETEAYAALGDEACHTFARPSSRDFIENHDAGDAYVYLNYGMHWLFNILVKSEKEAGFVLIRALEPLAGLTHMRARRKNAADALLCAGPARLTQALGIDGSTHGKKFLHGDLTWIEAADSPRVVEGPRIGISKAIDFPWRFGHDQSAFLSRKF